MNAKLKYTLAVVAFVFTVALSVGITYGVMAAHQVTLNSPINVTYTAKDVAATLSANYQIGNQSAVDFKTTNDETSIVFAANDATATKAFVSPGELQFDESKTITFTFSITNDGSYALTATVTLPETRDNVTVTTTDNTVTFNVAAGATKTVTVTTTVTDATHDAEFSGNFAWALVRAA